MSIIDSIKSVKKKLVPEKKPGDDIIQNVNRAHATNNAQLKAKTKRQEQISDCAVVLNECRDTFKKTILVENSLANEMRLKGYSTNKQATRVREAAIGILVVEQALFELESINSEADLNSAMNKMGMALRQLRRVDRSTAAISGSTERIVNQWFPGALGEETKAEDGTIIPSFEIPEEMRSVIDDAFVHNLMMGDSYQLAMAKHNAAPVEDKTSSRREDILTAVRETTNTEPPAAVDYSDIISQHTGNF